MCYNVLFFNLGGSTDPSSSKLPLETGFIRDQPVDVFWIEGGKGSLCDL